MAHKKGDEDESPSGTHRSIAESDAKVEREGLASVAEGRVAGAPRSSEAMTQEQIDEAVRILTAAGWIVTPPKLAD